MARHRTQVAAVLSSLLVAVAACAGTSPGGPDRSDADAVQPPGRRLQVVATTTIVGDVVATIGGDAIDLTVLLQPDADPHGFVPTSRDMVAVARADLVFVNGLGLEGNLESLLRNAADGTRVVAVSDGVAALVFGAAEHESLGEAVGEREDGAHGHQDEGAPEEEEHGDAEDGENGHDTDAADSDHEAEHDTDAAGQEHDADRDADAGHDHDTDAPLVVEPDADHRHDHDLDPHVWFDPTSVQTWTVNIELALAAADPTHTDLYAANAEALRLRLVELDVWAHQQVAGVPEDRRLLVADHHVLAYFARRYEFRHVGTVLPGVSTLAEPSAASLAALEDHIRRLGVPAIFVGTTVSAGLAERVAQDTGTRVVRLYTGSLSAPGGEADSYEAFMRYNVTAIVEALGRP